MAAADPTASTSSHAPSSPAGRVARALAGATVLASLATAVLCYFHGTQDDAFISYRYAKNLVEQGSLTFNGPGHQPVEGYSNFTWTLWVALAYATGVAPWLAAKLLGLVCLMASIAGAMRLTDEVLRRSSPWRLFAAATVGSSACFVCWSVQGLETPCIAALVIWSAVVVVRLLREPDDERANRRALAAGGLLGLLGISRPETALFGVLALAQLGRLAVADRRLRPGLVLRLGVTFALPVLAQFVFRVAYYDRITANTVYAKVHGALLWRGRTYLEHYVHSKGVALAAAGAVLFVVAWASTRRTGRFASGAGTVLLFVAAYAVFIVVAGGDWMMGFRFFMHVFPLLAVLGTWALAATLEALRSRWQRTPRALLAGAALAWVLYSNLHLEREYRFGAQGSVRDASLGNGLFDRGGPEQGPHWNIARWLKDNLPRGSLIALSEAGIVPFASELPVLDYVGLNERGVADLLHDERGDEVADYVLRRTPAAIVMTGQADARPGFVGRLPIDVALQSDARFGEHYRLARIEPLEERRTPSFAAFAIYLRR